MGVIVQYTLSVCGSDGRMETGGRVSGEPGRFGMSLSELESPAEKTSVRYILWTGDRERRESVIDSAPQSCPCAISINGSQVCACSIDLRLDGCTVSRARADCEGLAATNVLFPQLGRILVGAVRNIGHSIEVLRFEFERGRVPSTLNSVCVPRLLGDEPGLYNETRSPDAKSGRTDL
ncbi:hypothetical protein BD414DRAFT_477701, partial [Trametes punicea]